MRARSLSENPGQASPRENLRRNPDSLAPELLQLLNSEFWNVESETPSSFRGVGIRFSPQFVSSGSSLRSAAGDHSPVARWPSRTRTASAPRAPAGDSRSVLSTAPKIAKPTPTRRATCVPPAG